ncbi:putative HTH-type transcriptional regulator YxaF [Dictyobacter vulcani]|uniref:Putative HTH-type transcriptional regulator YxaF n=1 Tax=Dictyobacter vulcani TaxID=2607529 RepID=A0A5J4KQH1_9CHLR|nr:TetR/AcrR family transcriptional regulator [Dictyobacter vulcani]GER90115.1 putative HTH-type transcriptional regulator YxaF [Dictyobacter vulcani]
MASTRERILQTTCSLLEAQGYHATGLNQILIKSCTPKGSLYYYFPNGKEELASEAIRTTSRTVAEHIECQLAVSPDPVEAIRLFIQHIAQYIELSGFQAGGPLMMVALETVNSSEPLNAVCREAYQLLQAAFARKLISSGYSLEKATSLAEFTVASIEGGTILSRIQHSSAPLHRISEELGVLLRAATE